MNPRQLFSHRAVTFAALMSVAAIPVGLLVGEDRVPQVGTFMFFVFAGTSFLGAAMEGVLNLIRRARRHE
jgi:hypothetical protein